MRIFKWTILTTLEYKKMEHNLRSIARDYSSLLKDYEKVRKQLLYEQTFNKAFKQKLEDIIFPNTDERGLSDQETPLDFPDLW